MPTIWRVYSAADGRSHITRVTVLMKPFVDVEGAHGEGRRAAGPAGEIDLPRQV